MSVCVRIFVKSSISVLPTGVTVVTLLAIAFFRVAIKGVNCHSTSHTTKTYDNQHRKDSVFYVELSHQLIFFLTALRE